MCCKWMDWPSRMLAICIWEAKRKKKRWKRPKEPMLRMPRFLETPPKKGLFFIKMHNRMRIGLKNFLITPRFSKSFPNQNESWFSILMQLEFLIRFLPNNQSIRILFMVYQWSDQKQWLKQREEGQSIDLWREANSKKWLDFKDW